MPHRPHLSAFVKCSLDGLPIFHLFYHDDQVIFQRGATNNMKQQRSRSVPSSCQIETLESRTFLSASPSLAPLDTGGNVEHSAVVRDVKTARPVTQTLVKVKGGFLGQGDTFTVTVRAAAALGSPAGTVTLLNKGDTLTTITLTPSNSTNPKYSTSTGTYTIASGGGGTPFFFGLQRVGAAYTSTNKLLASKGYADFAVKTPQYSLRPGHLKVASVTPGSGAQITAGQTASVLYTGYLVSDITNPVTPGTIFDDSTKDGGTPLSYTVEASPEQVVTGFDRGTVGMEVGETRIFIIPPGLAYGTMGSGASVPPNAKLCFVVTLESIM
jgi:FKBP-type peptidyl-prolyl cis-trans isomerase FkpA